MLSRLIFASMAAAVLVPATTLERLTLDELITRSTAIVRGKVVGRSGSLRGNVVYTNSQLRVAQSWKGASGSSVTVTMPGGEANGLKQSFPGVPQLAPDSEYLLLLWTGKNGTTHVMGLSQGLFTVGQGDDGQTVIRRAANRDVTMLDPKTGKTVADQAVEMRMSEFTSRVEQLRGRSEKE